MRLYAAPKPAAPPPPSKDPTTRIAGGSRPRGVRAPTGAVSDPNAQPDVKLRALNAQPTTPGPREQVFCYKVGITHQGEMYIVGAHMDGHGFGEAANDNGSGTALVMELARILSSSDVQTDRWIRFVLWNNEETGLNGARAYVRDRAGLQGLEDPSGSRRFPEPRWLGMISARHDVMGRRDATGGWQSQPRPAA